MENKCNKYEAYFTFSNEEDFQKHLQECEDCRKQFEKEQRLSELIKDSASTYNKLKQKNSLKKSLVKTACALLVFSTLGLYTGINLQEKSEYQKFMTNNTETSIIAQEGLPTDEFGFFDYN